jgi:hypothetical protein
MFESEDADPDSPRVGPLADRGADAPPAPPDPVLESSSAERPDELGAPVDPAPAPVPVEARGRKALRLGARCLIVLLGLAAGFQLVCTWRRRVAEYDRWKLHGFSFYQVYNQGTGTCYLALHDAGGRPLEETMLRFDSRGRFVEAVGVDVEEKLRALANSDRERIAAFRAAHGLERPAHIGRALGDRRRSILYYGSAPMNSFTRFMAHGERRTLLFSSCGLRYARSLHSDRYHLILGVVRRRRVRGPVLAVELLRAPGGELTWKLHRFASLSRAKEELLSDCGHHNLEQVVGQMHHWARRR